MPCLGSIHYLWLGGGGGGGGVDLEGVGGGERLFFSILFWRGDFFLTHYFCELFFTKVT